MLATLLLAAISLRMLDAGGPVREVAIADVDADGFEDLLAMTAREMLIFRGGEGGLPQTPTARYPAPPLAVTGKGLLGFVREGSYRAVQDPFGVAVEGPPGVRPLLAALGVLPPAFLASPGDLDGDGRDDALLATEAGLRAGDLLIPARPQATLTVWRNEELAIAWQIPVAVAGSWSGEGREIVVLLGNDLVVFRGPTEIARLPLPLAPEGEEVAAIRRSHVLVRDVNGDGRLDLLLAQTEGKAGVFGAFEASVLLWPGGRIYDSGRRGFYRPSSAIKVAGALLEPSLLDLDLDGDLDLVLSTVNTSLLTGATGTAPGHYHLFRFGSGAFSRNPDWSMSAPVPLSSFTERPKPPVAFLPDYDRDGRPEALHIDKGLRLSRAAAEGCFEEAGASDFAPEGRPAVGSRFAAVPGPGGLLVVEAAR